MISVVIPGAAVPQGSVRSLSGRVVQGGTADSRDRLLAWRTQTAWLLRKEFRAAPPITGPVVVDLTFFLPKPKSRRRKNDPTLSVSTAKPDLDKLIRAALDAGTEAQVWRDDSQVYRIIAAKFETLGDPYTVFDILTDVGPTWNGRTA